VGIDPEGNVYVSDSNSRVTKFASDGTFLTKWGSSGSGDMNFMAPMDVIIDSANYIYVANQTANIADRIVKFRSTWLPAVDITSPLADASVTGTHKIQATASSDLGISMVEVYVDGVKLGDATAAQASSRAISGNFITAAAATYTYDWNTVGKTDGPHILKLIAYNTQNKTSQQEITVIVNNSNDQLPTVSITNPLTGDKVRLGTTIKAIASDDKGVTKVEFYVDGAKAGEDTSSPYEYVWDASTLTDGAHAVKATAYDTISQTKSATINVTVVNHEEFGYVKKWAVSGPFGLSFDKSGNILVGADRRIRKFSPEGAALAEFSRTVDWTFDFNLELYPAVDSGGNIYVSDSVNNSIIKLDASGKFIKKWGSLGSENAQFNWPREIAIDSLDNIYVADWGNHRIVKYDRNGNFITKWGAQGTNDGQFIDPNGLALDSSNNLYVVDPYTSWIQVFSADGTFIRKWSGIVSSDNQVVCLTGISVDVEGNVFISDRNNHRIFKFDPTGTFITKWGSFGSGDSQLSSPVDVLVDTSGNVYVSDQGNQRIVKFRSTWLPALEVTSPLADAIVAGTQKIQATATSDLGIVKVEIYVDGVKLGDAIAAQASSHAISGNFVAAAAATYSYNWNTIGLTEGSHTLKLIAYSTQNKTAQQEVTVIVNNSNDQLPKVAVSNPIDGQILVGTVAIKATASDDKGIARVDYFLDDVLLGTAASAPYDYAWDTTKTGDGRKKLKVTAVDTIGQKTSVILNVLINNTGMFFNVDLTNADVVYLTQDHKLKKVDKNGTMGSVVKDTIKVSQFQFDPLGYLYVVLEQKQELPDGKQYILVKVDARTNLMKGIDVSLNQLMWNTGGVSNNLQFDGAGNAYYFAMVTESGVQKKVLRKYVDESHIDDIINDNISISHWQVLPDGLIVIAGQTMSTGQNWLRRVNPNSTDDKISNMAEPSVGWIAKFPDGRVYTHLSGSWNNLDGIYKLPSDLHRLTQADSNAPYIGQKTNSTYKLDAILAGHSTVYSQGLRDSQGRNMIKFWTDKFNNLYGLMGYSYSANQSPTVLRLSPNPEIIEPTLIDKAMMMEVSLDQLVFAGYSNELGKYRLIVYDLQTKSEINIMFRNIEIYHLGVLYDGSIIFDGLDLGPNKVVIGMFERVAHSAPGRLGIQADTYTYKVLAQVGEEQDKPLKIEVVKPLQTTALSVEITSPADGATVSGTVDITAAVTPSEGVSKVEFYVDGVLKGTDTTAPHAYSWNTKDEVAGQHTLKARAFDAASKTAETQIEVTVDNTSPNLAISTKRLDFAAIVGGTQTSDQAFRITNAGDGTLIWMVADDAAWLTCAPASGTGNAAVTASVNPAGLAAGTYTATITISSTNATNSPQTIAVQLVVKGVGTTLPPFGEFSTPIDGTAGITGAIPVTGWVVDDIEVTKVEVKRDPCTGDPPGAIGPDGLVFVGNAIFVEGARPDIETGYPGYPMNYKAGWGYMLLTNFLPNGGNGTYKLHAFATDKEGHLALLGSKTIVCSNATASKPFGTIDTPTQGGDASGNLFLNFGWVLTPMPKTVPKNGSTIDVFVDSVKVGNLATAPNVYNQYRVDVATAFPGLNNSSGPVGAFYLDTTKYANGVHTIFWIATDDAGAADGIGSRYFNVMNTGTTSNLATMNEKSSHREERSDAAITPQLSQCEPLGVAITHLDSVLNLPPSFDPLFVKTGFSLKAEPVSLAPDNYGAFHIRMREVELLEMCLNPARADQAMNKTAGSGGLERYNPPTPPFRKGGEEAEYAGYLVVGDQLRPLPVGSTLDARTGMFSWMPGPGFIGTYDLVFVEKSAFGLTRSIKMKVTIRPKH